MSATSNGRCAEQVAKNYETSFEDPPNCNDSRRDRIATPRSGRYVISCTSRTSLGITANRSTGRRIAIGPKTNEPTGSFSCSLFHFQRLETMRLGLATILIACVGTATVSAGQGQPVTIEERAAGAERVVVANVSDIQSAFEVNSHGDQVIVSRMQLLVAETLKGPAVSAVPFAMEGGTVDGLTMRVSDLPTMQVGERAVFFLDSDASGIFQSHGRGLGILKVDASNHVSGSNLTLDDLRAMVRSAVARVPR